MVRITQNNDEERVKKALSSEPSDIPFEEIPAEASSPLFQPVVEKTEPLEQTQGPGDPALEAGETLAPEAENEQYSHLPPDAPEQVIGDNPGDEVIDPEFTIPPGHAALMADTVLGVTNNLLEVGLGYFVTVRKHKDFYDFDEVIQVIEDQNTHNVQRAKLDEEDKALLRPLLIQIIRKKGKTLTPEQQLLAALISIIIKKSKVVMEVRSENELLVERIREIIRQGQGTPEKEVRPGDPGDAAPEREAEDTGTDHNGLQDVLEVADPEII